MAWVPGQKIRALDLLRGIPEIAIRTANGSVVSTTTLANAAGMLIPVENGAIYSMDGWIAYSCPTGADLKLGFAVPGGTSGYFGLDGLIAGAAGSSADIGMQMVGLDQNITIGGTGGQAHARLGGYVVAGADGNVQLQYAQGTSNATPTQMLAGSYFSLRRVA